jgi:hypothetical protein
MTDIETTTTETAPLIDVGPIAEAPKPASEPEVSITDTTSDYKTPRSDYGILESLLEQEETKSPTIVETKQEPVAEPEKEPVTSETDATEEPEVSADTDDPEISRFKLDAELAKIPGATKRWQDQLAGVEKVKNRYQELLGQAEPAISWVNRFGDPSTAARTYQELGQVLAQQHGIPIEQFRGTTSQPTVDNSDLEPWEKEGFDYQAEYNIYEKAKQAALKQVKDELAPYLNEIQSIKQQREQAAALQQQQDWLDSVAPKTIKLLEKTENGWPVTKDMVNAAVSAFPQLRNDPAKAVKALYADELKEHTAKVASALMAPKGPEILPTGGNTTAKKEKEWHEYGITDFLSKE